MSNELNLQLPTEIVERAVRDKINAAIAEQLGDPQEMITKLVSAALSQKVSSNGKRSRSDYDNRFDFLEVVTGTFIREAAQEALHEYLEENKSKIKEAVKKEVGRSPSKFAKIFVDGMIGSMSSRHYCNISFQFDSKDDQ